MFNVILVYSFWYVWYDGQITLTGYRYPLQWRHNGRDSVSSHQPHHCLLNRLFRRKSKKTSKDHVTGLCAGNSPVTGEFPAQMASNAENVSIWWRHHTNGCLNPRCRGTHWSRGIELGYHRVCWCPGSLCRQASIWWIYHSLVFLNSSPPSAAYMDQRTGSSLVQVMACRRIGDKPLPKLMLANCLLDFWEQISVKF